MIQSTGPTRNSPIVYQDQGSCIYCGETSTPLQREHIIALGLGGGLILPQSSCAKCAEITGSVEQECLRRFFGLHRAKIGLKSNRRKEKKKFHIRRRRDGRNVEIDVDDLPHIVIMPLFATPSVLLTGRLHNLPLVIIDHKTFLFSQGRPTLINLHGPYSIDQPYNLMLFARMLAKIAHSYAVADLGAENFTPYLLPVILGTDISYVGSVVGQTTGAEPAPSGGGSHFLNISTATTPGSVFGGEWIVVRIGLFEQWLNVTYSIVVGKLTPTPTYLKWKGLQKLPFGQLAALRRHYGILPARHTPNCPMPP